MYVSPPYHCDNRLRHLLYHLPETRLLSRLDCQSSGVLGLPTHPDCPGPCFSAHYPQLAPSLSASVSSRKTINSPVTAWQARRPTRAPCQSNPPRKQYVLCDHFIELWFITVLCLRLSGHLRTSLVSGWAPFTYNHPAPFLSPCPALNPNSQLLPINLT